MDWYPQNKYSLLLKTGDAEIRAAKHFTTLSNLLPIIELTRGRKSKNDKIKHRNTDENLYCKIEKSNRLKEKFYG